MIVDIHTHFFRPDLDFEPVLKGDMKRCGVDPAVWGDIGENHLSTTKDADVAIVFGLRAKATGWDIPNQAVAAHVARAPQRLLFFAAIDPKDPACLDELRHCHANLGATGVKMAPLYQGMHPMDIRYHQIYEYCEEHGLPILFHTGTSFAGHTELDHSRPVHFDSVAVAFPELRMILAHLGHPWEGELIAVIRRHPHVYADLSALYYRPWQFYNSMSLAVEYKTHSKIIFGSDYPFTTTGSSIAGVRNINHVLGKSGLPEIPSEVLEGIIHRDSLSLLNLPDPRKLKPATPTDS